MRYSKRSVFIYTEERTAELFYDLGVEFGLCAAEEKHYSRAVCQQLMVNTAGEILLLIDTKKIAHLKMKINSTRRPKNTVTLSIVLSITTS